MLINTLKMKWIYFPETEKIIFNFNYFFMLFAYLSIK